MKKIIQIIENPTWVTITLMSIVSIVLGTITAEIISRPVNLFFVSLSFSFTVLFSMLTIRTIVIWVYNYIDSNSNN